MALTIKWSDEAKKNFDENIDYLEEKWTEKEIKIFISHVIYIISKIKII